MKNLVLALFSLSAFFLKAQYLPQCNDFFYSITTTTAQASNLGTVNNPTNAPFVFPAMASGLAVAPGFSLGISNPSFWTIANDTLWYSNGTSFVKSNHKIGNINATGIGGSRDFIYALDAATGQVYKYNGLGTAAYLTTISSYTNGGLAQDLVGDELNNFYVLDLQNPQALKRYDASGVAFCSYSLSGIPTSTAVAESFAIVGNTITVQRGSDFYIGSISGNSVSFSLTTHSLNAPVDFASCPVSNTFTSQAVSNAGACLNSTLTLSAVSSLSATAFNWSGPGIVGASTTQSIQVNMPGVYSCTLQSNDCIPKISACSFTVLALPSLSISGNTVFCSGNSTSLTVSGASTYTWSPGASVGSTLSISPSVSTSYIVSGTDTNGCLNTASVAVLVNPLPVIGLTASQASICNGQTATLSATGASSYTWLPGNTVSANYVQSPASTTTYSVSGTDVNGCGASSIITLTVNQNPVIALNGLTSGLCSGNSGTLSASGASTYTWQPGNFVGTTYTVSPLSTTIYTVDGEDLFGCAGTQSIVITVTATPVLTVAASPSVICSGGSSTLTVAGAASYTWTQGSIVSETLSVSALLTNSYTVIGANGVCLAAGSVNLPVNPNPTLSITNSPGGICSGSTNTLTVSGADNYVWQPGAIPGSSAVVSPTITTTYAVTGSYSTGCSSLFTSVLSVTLTPTVTALSNTSAVCSGNSATLSANGATSYTWLPLVSTNSLVTVTPSASTIYTVIGANGTCTDSQMLSVTVNTNPIVSASVTNPTICSGKSTTLSAAGAVSYNWLPVNLNGTSVSVSPGTTTAYTVTGTNSAGCSSTAGITVSVSATPSVSAVTTHTGACASEVFTLTASGATNYTWAPVALTGSNVTWLSDTTITFSVLGKTGACVNTTTLTVLVYPTPTVSIIPTQSVLCANQTFTFSGSGASTYGFDVPPYTIISPSSAAMTFTAGGNHLLIVRGYSNYGCYGLGGLFVYVNPEPTFTVTSSSSANVNLCNGSTTTLSASGSVSYSWQPTGATSSSIVVSPTTTTVYSVVATSSVGCVSQTPVLYTVSVSLTPTLVFGANAYTTCESASVTLSAGGAQNYTWTPGNLTGSMVVVSPSVSTVFTILGANGSCTSSQTLQVSTAQIPVLNVAASSNSICSGSSLTMTVNGASTYTWMPGNFTGSTNILNPALSTLYVIYGTDANGCNANVVTTVTVINTPTVNVAATSTAQCAGSVFSLTASGAISYNWFPGNMTGSSATVIPAMSTTYTLSGSNGACASSQTLHLSVSPLPVLSINTNTLIDLCSGKTVTVSANGANTYTWMPGNLPGSNVLLSPLASTNYTLVAANASQCKNSLTFSIQVLDVPALSISATRSVICTGEELQLVGSGATTYTWNNGSFGNTLVDIPTTGTAAVYSLSGMSTEGCISSPVSFTISLERCDGLNDQERQNNLISFYPNPGKGVFFINSDLFSPQYMVEIYNATGQRIKEELLLEKITVIDLTDQPNALYFVAISKNGQLLKRSKLIKN